MKNLLFICLITPLISFGQYAKGRYANPNPQPIKIQVSKAPKTSADHYSDMQKNISQDFRNLSNNLAANARVKASATSEAMKDNYSRINTDNLINNDGAYKTIVIDNVSGWKTVENKKTITKILEIKSKYNFYSQRKQIPKFLKDSNETLYLSWSREADGYSRITNIQVRDSQGEVVYDVTHKNKSYIEMFKPFTSSYKMNKEMALQKLRELKELKELEVITKEDYDSYVQKYKSIILKGF